ncbi:hypothetical protein [Kitasatospora sp. NPDC047058]|uniref:hypothetical protein n=1 Tax=Kitasatospora sp. NPDC047058 TaxID=3155620 RepID=UPI0033FABE60
MARTATHLSGVSFTDLWQTWTRRPSSEPDEELRERLARDHVDLRAFYGRSAEQGWAVAEHFSF